MFDFLYGGTKRVQLVRDLMSYLNRGDYDDIEGLSKSQLFNTPEGIIVDLTSSIYKMQSRGFLLGKCVAITEQSSGLYGSFNDHSLAPEIKEKFMGSISDAAQGVDEYIYLKIYLSNQIGFLGRLVPSSMPTPEDVSEGIRFVLKRLMTK